MMSPAVALHLEHIEQRRCSPTTIAARRAVLERLPGAPESIDRAAFDEWWRTRQHKADGTLKAPRSLAVELSHLRSFYSWALEEEIVIKSPVRRDLAPKVGRSRPDPIREPALRLALDKSVPPMTQILALGALAGLRSAEIAVVQWSDLDLDAEVLWVRHGKGDKDRSVPLSAALLEVLGPAWGGFIVTGRDGQPLSAKSVSARVARYLRGLGVNATAHKLRARFATKHLEGQGNIISTRDVLGHATISATEVYLRATDRLARKGARAAGKIG